VVQHDRPAGLDGQLLQRTVQGHPVRGVRIVADRLGAVVTDRELASVAAPPADADAVGHGPDPRLRTPVAVELTTPVPGPDEGLLGAVLRLGEAAAGEVHMGDDAVVALRVEGVERRLVHRLPSRGTGHPGVRPPAPNGCIRSRLCLPRGSRPAAGPGPGEPWASLTQVSEDLFGNPTGGPADPAPGAGGPTGGSLGAADHAGAPLAVRLRPRTVDEIVGQQHLLGPGSPLRRLASGTGAMSVFLWGPPGVGKTTIAAVVSQSTRRRLVEVSAVTAGVKEVRAVLERARRDLVDDVQTVLFVDEVHRFSKSQQDVLLPAVENRIVTLIAATTENPSFS